MSLQTLLKGVRLLSPKPDLNAVRLVTIGLSHYSEKARWALDIADVDYYEELHCPAMHLSSTVDELRQMPRIATWGNDKHFLDLSRERHDAKSLKRKEMTAVPKLVLPADFLVRHNIPFPTGSELEKLFVVSSGSSGILKFLSQVYPERMGSIYPPGDLGREVTDLEHLLDVDLGNAATKWCFGNLILTGNAFKSRSDRPISASAAAPSNAKSLDVFLNNVVALDDLPFVEKALFRMLGKRFIVPLMIKYNGISGEEVLQARDKICEVFQFMDQLVPPPSSTSSGKFLFGSEQLTAADITFAALAVPILLPTQTEPLVGSLRLCDSFGPTDNAPGCSEIAFLAKDLRKKHRSAQYALHLYEKYRLLRPSASPLMAGAGAEGSGMDTAFLGDKYGEDSLNMFYKNEGASQATNMYTTTSRASASAAAGLDAASVPLHLRFVFPRTKQFRSALPQEPKKTMNYNSCKQKYAN
jgi:hypothetical protein